MLGTPNTTKTPNLFISFLIPFLCLWHIYIGPPQSIEHRCLEYHYTKYTGPPKSIEHRGLEFCYTAYIYIYIYIYILYIYIYVGPPQSIEYRCLEYRYTKYIGPPQSIKYRGLAYCYTAYIYIYIYIYIYVCVCLYICIYICHRHRKGIRKEMKRLGGFIVFGVPVWMPVDMQMNHGRSNAPAQWFSTGRLEQMIMTS